MPRKEKGVTGNQLEHIKLMAQQKGISGRVFQDRFIDGGLAGIALDAAKIPGARLKLIPPIEAPPWGRIYFVDNVSVQLDRDWQSGVNEIASDTKSDYLVCRIGHLYKPCGTSIVKANFVLVNLNGNHYREALAWANKYELPLASPRHVFALVKAQPNLNANLNMNSCYIVAPQEFMFQDHMRVCLVWFDGCVREADTMLVSNVRHNFGWVAFLRV